MSGRLARARLIRVIVLALVATFVVASLGGPLPRRASAALAAGAAIILPFDALVTATVVGKDAAFTHDLGLARPERRTLIPAAQPGAAAEVGTFAAGSELVFFLFVRNTGAEFLSDGDHARVTRAAETSWTIGWEDLTDFDFNDLVISIVAADPLAELLGASFGDGTVGAYIADPVNTFSGNLNLRAMDLALPGRGPALRLARSYNGRDDRAGIFGRGWTSDLEWRVTERGSRATVTRADGRRDVHMRRADGGYDAPRGVFDTLTRTASGWSLLAPEQVRVEFDGAGAPTRIADRSGNALAFTADAAGRIVRMTDAVGRSIDLAYGAGGRLVSATDSTGRAVGYAYTDGRLGAVTDAAGATTRYAYDALGRLATLTDPLGNVVLRLAYDDRGRVTEQRDALGGITRFAYGAGRVTTTTTPRGTATTIAHDANARVTALTDAAGSTVAYTYDGRGAQTSFRDRSGNLWSFAYDTRGNRTEVIDPIGGRVTFTYDERNDLRSRTDPLGHAWQYAYDARGNLASVTDPEGERTTVESDVLGQPTRITDADGVVVRYAYDALGNVIDVRTAAGTARIEYDAAGRPTTRTDANRHATTFRYDARDRLTGVTDALGKASALGYDVAGNLLAISDRRGQTSSFAYDSARRLIASSDPLGALTSFAYDANGNRTSITDPLGQQLRFEYDALDRLASVTDPEGGRTQFAYDPNGNLLLATDPRGGVARHTYDFRNARSATTDRAGATTRYAYDAAGRLVGTTDPTAASTRFAYDGAGRLVTTADALGGLTRVAYTAAGRRTSLVDPLGSRTAFAYDAAGRLASFTDPLGGIARFAYDAGGNRTSSTDQLGRATRFTYDALDRLATISDALGGLTRYSYDPEGALASLRDANGGLTRYAYDAAGRLVTVTDAAGGVTRYAYDTRGLLTKATDANGHARGYQYDGARRFIRESDALGRARTTVYDASGNPVLITDAKGQATSLGYDAEDRLTSLRYADGTVVRLERDARGDRTRMTDALGMTTYRYDALRRLVGTTDPFGQSVEHGYDAAGRRTGLRYPDGTAATFAYDAGARLVEVAEGSARHRYSYDAVANLVSADLANGTSLRARYDALDRPLSLDQRDARGRALASFAYTYDALGNVLSERARGGEDEDDERATLRYRYDALSRLVSVRGGGDDDNEATTFRYDAVGNRVAVNNRGDDDDDERSLRATFDAADQLTTLQGQNGKVRTSFRYDQNGSLIERRERDRPTTYTYDAAGRLVSVAGPARESAAFRYDGDGNLYEERRGGGGEGEHARTPPDPLRYTLDLAAPLIQALAANKGPDSARYLYGPAGRISATGATGARTYHTDVRQSVRATSDERGRARGSFGYDAWGIPDERERDEDDEDERRTSLTSLFGHIGERQDPASGLVFLRARWYAPEFGRFLSRDAFAGTPFDPRTHHPYVYAQDNPTSKVDRTGFSAASLFDAIDGYAYDGAALYGAFPAPASFRLPANVPAAISDGGLLGGIRDFAGGFGGGLVNTVTGALDVGAGVYRSTVACQFGFLGPLQQLCAEQWQANRELAGYIFEDPPRFARQSWDAATENCANALSGASSAGACAFDALSLVLGAKGIDKVAKLANLSRGAKAGGEVAAAIERSSPMLRTAASTGGRSGRIRLADAAAAARRNGIDMRMFELRYEPGRAVYGFISLTGSGALVRGSTGRILLTLQDPGLASALDAVQTIAHELNHARGVLRTGHATSEVVAEAAARAVGGFLR